MSNFKKGVRCTEKFKKHCVTSITLKGLLTRANFLMAIDALIAGIGGHVSIKQIGQLW